MTAENILCSREENEKPARHLCLSHLVKHEKWTSSRKYSRMSLGSSPASQCKLPDYSDNDTNNSILSSTRPRTSSPRTKDYPHHGQISSSSRGGTRHASRKSQFLGTRSQEMWASDAAEVSEAKLSRAAKLLEEDRKKASLIRSFLLHFLEDRDCSIKKRVNLNAHQTETGRPVTDAVVQEVCKLRPDMIGMNLRDCVEITDVGLWCVARHTMALRELNIGGCHGVTNIGIRSLAICCDKIGSLDFTGCTRLTDAGLRVIGGGCWDLRSLTLEGCSNVTDGGVAELAKMCTGLTYLNISRCDKVGEYGDRALIQLGKSCHQLRGLDAYGCAHAQDPGLLAVARGCSKLEKLMLTGCGEITGKSVRALARGCVGLRELSVSGCDKIGNGDLKELARCCSELRHLDIARCSQVNAHGLAALAKGLRNLTGLDLGSCERVDDAALRALCSMNAQFLNLSGCMAVTESGVAGIALNCTALSTLNVTGCPGIQRRFMAQLCHKMKLSEPAQDFFGFQPRKNAKELLAKAEAENRKIFAAILLQKHIRGRLARGRGNITKRHWTIEIRLARIQAITRGYFARKWYREWRAQVREHRSAATIQATWRMLGDRRTASRLRVEAIARQTGQGFATRIQSAWRGHGGRVRTREIRAVRARRLLLEARAQAKRELSAIVVQSIWRSYSARIELGRLRQKRDELVALEQRRQWAAVTMQSLVRMRIGMRILGKLKGQRNRKVLEWEMALRVQTAWRGKKGRMLVAALHVLRLEKLQHEAAIVIQSFWRAVRARHLTDIQRAMFGVRQMQGGAAKDVQRVYRGFKGRLRAKAKRSLFESDRRREKAAVEIQRIYRGHRGRQWFECKQHLRALQHKTRPLQHKLDELSAVAGKLAERLKKVKSSAGPIKSEKAALREELYHIKNTKDKYTDSDKISGIMQRFLTKFLHVRLVELQTLAEKRLEALEAEALELEVKERRNLRLLRQTERELLPLGRGTIEKVKLMRTARLRKKVRSVKAGATSIQRVFRGWRVRSALSSWYRDYWLEAKDEATGDVYYVNTWNNEARWVKPLELSLFESDGGGSSRPGTCDSSLQDGGRGTCGGEFDDADGVSIQYRQRLEQLTAEAVKEAEVEAQSSRLSADDAEGTGAWDEGSKGQREPAINDAAWRRIALDDRLGPNTPPCWYNIATSEYHWGDNPPVQIRKIPLDRMRLYIPAHRVDGEAWLKRQDVDEILRRSQAVRDIGSAGWRQLTVPRLAFLTLGPDAGTDNTKSATNAVSTTTTRNVENDDNGGVDQHHLLSEGDDNVQQTTGLPQGEARDKFPQCLTVFHHATTGELRWCLSPRSVLETPLLYQHEQNRVRIPTSSFDEGDLREMSDRISDREGEGKRRRLECVEDGDMVYYYNTQLGTSKWELPEEETETG